MCKNKKVNQFTLRAACNDCPFRKENNYLHHDRISEIMRYMSDDDLLFPCHKTLARDARQAYEDALDSINYELEISLDNVENLAMKRTELEVKYNIEELTKNLQKQMIHNEKICAGWLILGKKENLINNNFRLRLAQMQNLFSVNQFKDEDSIFDSINDAFNACER